MLIQRTCLGSAGGGGLEGEGGFGESRAGRTERTRPLATQLCAGSVQVRGGGKRVDARERGDWVRGAGGRTGRRAGNGMGVGCLSAEEGGRGGGGEGGKNGRGR